MAQEPEPTETENEKKPKVASRPFLGKLEKNKCRIGIVGLPNVGKSSLFNTFSTKQVPAENYPFCTIQPAQAIVAVPDKRWTHLCEVYAPRSRIQAVLEIWDIAGLVRGAHEGKGLGNEFLSNIQSVDAIYHVVRAFKDKMVEHVDGSVDPIRDLETISFELRAKDRQTIAGKFENMEKMAKRSNDRKIKKELVIIFYFKKGYCVDVYVKLIEVVGKIKEVLEAGKDVNYADWTSDEIEYIRGYNLFTAKPVVFLVNVSMSDWEKGSNKFIGVIQEWVDKHFPGSAVIPFSAVFEAKVCLYLLFLSLSFTNYISIWYCFFDFKKLLEMDESKREAYLKEHKTRSMLDKIITSGYKALHLIHFFTAGEDEVRCWTVRATTKAPQAAGTIHTDFEKGFICAETMSYKDFKKCGSESAAKANGKYIQNGKSYEVQDGDIMYFKFNKPTSKK
ncbi:yyaF/YCHF TRANSFAC/OBG family small GTpase plus RNA binding domain TGS [Reticulomyxa filosa]|uniref:Obg-like ATPase homolog n=1 Tax=Reticulomyxa filosa TaxID=46433 RepID=X6M6X9_RETFI|nr:yyaF/YCHF TRANSFAC/OBG family small GTpase plus RNA binding domain TGS [Reticulomyxa filosa]|eukprot:ETO08785.1 yyaF/YCHF TRANSFAC/OBG family small GTpase plus RNA binding domain TGS [Reticulomyxa filosa]